LHLEKADIVHGAHHALWIVYVSRGGLLGSHLDEVESLHCKKVHELVPSQLDLSVVEASRFRVSDLSCPQILVFGRITFLASSRAILPAVPQKRAYVDPSPTDWKNVLDDIDVFEDVGRGVDEEAGDDKLMTVGVGRACPRAEIFTGDVEISEGDIGHTIPERETRRLAPVRPDGVQPHPDRGRCIVFLHLMLNSNVVAKVECPRAELGRLGLAELAQHVVGGKNMLQGDLGRSDHAADVVGGELSHGHVVGQSTKAGTGHENAEGASATTLTDEILNINPKVIHQHVALGLCLVCPVSEGLTQDRADDRRFGNGGCWLCWVRVH